MSRGRRRRLSRAGALLLLCLLPAACRRASSPATAPLRPPAAAEAPTTLADAEGVVREGTALAAGRSFEWELPEKASGRLRFSWTSPGGRGAITLVLEALAGRWDRSPRRLAAVRHDFSSGAGAVFRHEDLAVGRLGSRRLLRLRAEPDAALFLSDVRLVRPDRASPALVLLVFDTTRRDAVGFGGCPDPSTPRLDAILRRAWKASRAYAPASWTIPSMASLLTGRVPAALEDSNGAPLGVARGIPTIADDFRRAGWSTAAYVANPTLRRENGFASGFTTFYTTPYEGGSIALPAAETLRRLPSWLEAHRGEPYLLWVHLMDPHDPYSPPDRPKGKTPFDPGYRGAFVGDEVNRLQLGDPPPAAAADARHLEALYHDEVRYADERFGGLWKSLPEPERARATLVFTADHGEEFGAHGGWKHGPALYDDVLRVPLAIRPGAGRRFPEIPPAALVSLLDLLPTLEALAGLPPPGRPLDGANLIDAAAWKRDRLPPVTMLTGGAPRAAVVRDGSKLFFFDRLGTRGIPDPKTDPAGSRLARHLPEILPGLVRFDLAADPGETRRLPIDRRTFAFDWREVERAMAHTRRGLELRVSGTGTLRLRVEGFSGDARAEPFALEENDRFSWSPGKAGPALEAALDLADGLDGFLLEDTGTGPLRIDLPGDPREVCAELRLAGARPVRLASGEVREIPRQAVPAEIPLFEAPDGCASVFLWRAAGSARARTPEEEAEAWRKLRALGYLH